MIDSIDNQSKIQSKRVLVVDDKPENLRLLVQILSIENYVVNPAINGKAALRFLELKQDLPDIILLDVDMPGMNGYQLCKRLKASQRTCDIPVIFVSAADQVTDKVKAFSNGGVDYITKPFHEEEVLMRLQTHLVIRDKQKRLQQSIQERTTEAAEFKAKLDKEIGLRKELSQHANTSKKPEGKSFVGKYENVLVLPIPYQTEIDLSPAPACPSAESFSERELQILKFLKGGLTNRDIAKQAFLSEATVKWHLQNIYLKLGVNNRSKAIVEAGKLLLV